MAEIEIRVLDTPEISGNTGASLARIEILDDVAELIRSDENLDDIFGNVQNSLLGMFDAECATVYFVDKEHETIFSKFKAGDPDKEIRVVMNKNSVAGYVSVTESFISIMDAYNELELLAIYPDLKFDRSWDAKSGFRTKQIMAHPLMYNNRLMGVLQVINKKHGDSFTSQDWTKIRKISEVLGFSIYNQEKRVGQYKTGFDYLVSKNIISRSDLEQAMSDARGQKLPVSDVLMKVYRVSKADLGKSLAAFYNVSFFNCEQSFIASKELLDYLNMKNPFKFMERNGWAPFREKEECLHILCDDPSDYAKVCDIQRVVKNGRFELYAGLPGDINRIIHQLSGKPQPVVKKIETAQAGSAGNVVADTQNSDSSDICVDEIDHDVIRLVDNIILEAYKKGVSDIHIEAYPEDENTIVRFRQDGICFQHRQVPSRWKKAVVARIKIMANLDIAERRLPQDGKIRFRKGRKTIELRVATLPTVGGNEDAVLRVLSSSEPMPLEKLHLHPRNLESFKDIMAKPYGIFLVVGPTGSGKTTTLHSAIRHINTPQRKIWTAEDPVEITQRGLRQVQVRSEINLTFASAMRAFLRADPDVIMIGEMRDRETAAIGIEASLTGHLVLSTLHTNSAPETVSRLIDLGVDPFSFGDGLLGIAAQRLVRTLCPFCKTKHSPANEEIKLLAKEYGEERWPEMEQILRSGSMCKAKGCAQCNGTGFKGRIGLHEILVINPEIKRLIQNKGSVDEIRTSAIKHGMRTLKQDGIWKALKGETDIEHVRAVCAV